MNNLVHLVALLFAVILWHAVECAPKKAENCDPKTLEKCANKLFMLGDDSFIFPTTTDQMNKRCKDLKPLEKCIKDYQTKCLDGYTRNSISVIVYGVSKTNKGYCVNKARKNAFTSFGNCANANRNKLNKLLEEMNQNFFGASTYKDPKLRIPMACCNFYKFKHQILELTSSSDKCKAPEVQEIENLLDGYSRDGLNLLCGDYSEESDKCTHTIKKTPKWDKPLPSTSFVNAMVQIFQSI